MAWARAVRASGTANDPVSRHPAGHPRLRIVRIALPRPAFFDGTQFRAAETDFLTLIHGVRVRARLREAANPGCD
jgi:hypothetical protein